MPHETRVVAPGSHDRSVVTAAGQTLAVPAGWILVPPGDPALTRRIKAAGPTWTVQQKRGRKLFSLGVWTAAEPVAAIRLVLEEERATEGYQKKRAADTKRREHKQTAYVGSFRDAVLEFLKFAPCHEALAGQLADAVTAHATPVGSGTVARTERIPIEQRAESAVIAWMRHQTTGYDTMSVPRVKGKRREVRRELAEQSRRLLHNYRAGQPPAANCPLAHALRQPEGAIDSVA